MKRLLFLMGSLALLQGCTTPEQRAAQVREEVENMMRVYGPACEKLGFAKDTDLWRECILNLSARHRTRPGTTTCTAHSGFYDCVTY